MIDPRIHIIPTKKSGWNRQGGTYTQWCAIAMDDIYVSRPGIAIEVGKKMITVKAMDNETIFFDNGTSLCRGQKITLSETANEGLQNDTYYELTLYWDPSTPPSGEIETPAWSPFEYGSLLEALRQILSVDWQQRLEQIAQKHEGHCLATGVDICFLRGNAKSGGYHVKTYYNAKEMEQRLSVDIGTTMDNAGFALCSTKYLTARPWTKISNDKTVFYDDLRISAPLTAMPRHHLL